MLPTNDPPKHKAQPSTSQIDLNLRSLFWLLDKRLPYGVTDTTLKSNFKIYGSLLCAAHGASRASPVMAMCMADTMATMMAFRMAMAGPGPDRCFFALVAHAGMTHHDAAFKPYIH